MFYFFGLLKRPTCFDMVCMSEEGNSFAGGLHGHSILGKILQKNVLFINAGMCGTLDDSGYTKNYI